MKYNASHVRDGVNVQYVYNAKQVAQLTMIPRSGPTPDIMCYSKYGETKIYGNLRLRLRWMHLCIKRKRKKGNLYSYTPRRRLGGQEV
jgi:hypothetical protein